MEANGKKEKQRLVGIEGPGIVFPVAGNTICGGKGGDGLAGTALRGWNCRHSFSPYFEGMARTYSKERLEHSTRPRNAYNGQKMTEYEATQTQRGIERKVRRWERENTAMEAAGQDTSQSAAKLSQWQETQKDFLRQTGLKPDAARTQIAGFGRSQAGKTTAAG